MIYGILIPSFNRVAWKLFHISSQLSTSCFVTAAQDFIVNVSIYFLRNEHLDSFYYFKITHRSQMNSLPHVFSQCHKFSIRGDSQKWESGVKRQTYIALYFSRQRSFCFCFLPFQQIWYQILFCLIFSTGHITRPLCIFANK